MGGCFSAQSQQPKVAVKPAAKGYNKMGANAATPVGKSPAGSKAGSTLNPISGTDQVTSRSGSRTFADFKLLREFC